MTLDCLHILPGLTLTTRMRSAVKRADTVDERRSMEPFVPRGAPALCSVPDISDRPSLARLCSGAQTSGLSAAARASGRGYRPAPALCRVPDTRARPSLARLGSGAKTNGLTAAARESGREYGPASLGRLH